MATSVLFYGDNYRMSYIIRKFIEAENYNILGIATPSPESFVYLLNQNSIYPNNHLNFSFFDSGSSTGAGDYIEVTDMKTGSSSRISLYAVDPDSWTYDQGPVDIVICSTSIYLSSSILTSIMNIGVKAMFIAPGTPHSSLWGQSNTLDVLSHAYHINDYVIDKGSMGIYAEVDVANHILAEIFDSIYNSVHEYPAYCMPIQICPSPYPGRNFSAANTQDMTASDSFSNNPKIRSNFHNIRYNSIFNKIIGKIVPAMNGKTIGYQYSVPGTSCGLMKVIIGMNNSYTLDDIKRFLKISSKTLGVSDERKCPLDMLDLTQGEIIIPSIELLGGDGTRSNTFTFTVVYDDTAPIPYYLQGSIEARIN